jgi:DNA-directed RNA polymerase I, II, and III subunit RPABC1
VESQPDDPRAHPRPSKPPCVSFLRKGALNGRKGFAVAEEEIGMSLEEFKAVYGRGQAVECALLLPVAKIWWDIDRASGSRNSLGFFATAANNPSEQIYVYFCDERNVGVKSMRK